MSSQNRKSTPKNLQEVVDEWRQVECAEGVQTMLWTMYYAAIGSSESDDWGPMTRANMAYLFQRLHNLVHDLDPERSKGRIDLADNWFE